MNVFIHAMVRKFSWGERWNVLYGILNNTKKKLIAFHNSILTLALLRNGTFYSISSDHIINQSNGLNGMRFYIMRNIQKAKPAIFSWNQCCNFQSKMKFSTQSNIISKIRDYNNIQYNVNISVVFMASESWKKLTPTSIT